MLNENVLALSICIMAISLAYIGLDDGNTVKTVISAYLGYLLGKRYRNNSSDSDNEKN
jgi:hypothetical protein